MSSIIPPWALELSQMSPSDLMSKMMPMVSSDHSDDDDETRHRVSKHSRARKLRADAKMRKRRSKR